MSKDDKFYKTAQVAFQKLSPKRGDIITVSFPSDMAIEQVRATATYFQQLCEEFDCPVICVAQGIQIAVQSEEEMNEMGWYRKETTKRTLN